MTTLWNARTVGAVGRVPRDPSGRPFLQIRSSPVSHPVCSGWLFTCRRFFLCPVGLGRGSVVVENHGPNASGLFWKTLFIKVLCQRFRYRSRIVVPVRVPTPTLLVECSGHEGTQRSRDGVANLASGERQTWRDKRRLYVWVKKKKNCRNSMLSVWYVKWVNQLVP